MLVELTSLCSAHRAMAQAHGGLADAPKPGLPAGHSLIEQVRILEQKLENLTSKGAESEHQLKFSKLCQVELRERTMVLEGELTEMTELAEQAQMSVSEKSKVCLIVLLLLLNTLCALMCELWPAQRVHPESGAEPPAANLEVGNIRRRT